MLQGEHSAILSTFIKLPIVIKIVVLSILSGHFTQVLLHFFVVFQLEQALLSQKQLQMEADLAKKEKERLEEMRKREQNRIMEVMFHPGCKYSQPLASHSRNGKNKLGILAFLSALGLKNVLIRALGHRSLKLYS